MAAAAAAGDQRRWLRAVDGGRGKKRKLKKKINLLLEIVPGNKKQLFFLLKTVPGNKKIREIVPGNKCFTKQVSVLFLFRGTKEQKFGETGMLPCATLEKSSKWDTRVYIHMHTQLIICFCLCMEVIFSGFSLT